MSPKRPKLPKAALDDFFLPTQRRRAPPPYDQKYARHTYRLPDGLHDKLRAIAEQEGVGLNDMVRYVFQTFTRQYDAGEIGLPNKDVVGEAPG